MKFIGDIHGKVEEYIQIIRTCEQSIQLGDFGYGFIPINTRLLLSLGDHKFLRGNHDKPSLCRKKKNYLGEYGYLESQGIFFVSGADSIDKDNRVEGYTWWRDEQLTYRQMDSAIQLYTKVKPRIVCSHDCPRVIYEEMGTTIYKAPSFTTVSLSAMLSVWQPEFWVFGHHHKDFQLKIGDTMFVGLDELSTYTVD